jgi:23S rRNA pseudouridine1911/1915/1917 synthase
MSGMEWTADTSERLDIFLANRNGAPSRMAAKGVIAGGAVMVNGRIVRKAAHVLKPGDVVQASPAGEPLSETRIGAVDLELPVLHEDDACFVLNKPAGVTVHPGAGLPASDATILHGIAHLFAARGLPFASAAVLVHRLDKETTGCLLVAKNPHAHKMLQKQFEQRTVHKTYLALVAGIPHPAAAIIDSPIGRSGINRTKMSVLGATRTRDARTTYRTLGVGRDCALVECDLHTGRTHQIRVHLATIGHPVIGDPSYSSSTADKIAAHLGIESLCLHAWKLSFESPDGGKNVAVVAPPPAGFDAALKAAGISADRE